MKIPKPPKRSVSPFAGVLLTDEPVSVGDNPFDVKFPIAGRTCPKTLTSLEEAGFIPQMINRFAEAPSNDAPGLSGFCDYLVKYRLEFEQNQLFDEVFNRMMVLFDQKTEIFLVDHHDKASCEKMEWPLPYKDSVLFSKERDTLIGRFFVPITDMRQGFFLDFISHWTESQNRDQVLHFFDFCKGVNDPSFEYYLLFSHPILRNVLLNKEKIAGMLKLVEPVFQKINSPTWANDAKKALRL